MSETRRAKHGELYTCDDFLKWYGDARGQWEWAQAEKSLVLKSLALSTPALPLQSLSFAVSGFLALALERRELLRPPTPDR